MNRAETIPKRSMPVGLVRVRFPQDLLHLPAAFLSCACIAYPLQAPHEAC